MITAGLHLRSIVVRLSTGNGIPLSFYELEIQDDVIKHFVIVQLFLFSDANTQILTKRRCTFNGVRTFQRRCVLS